MDKNKLIEYCLVFDDAVKTQPFNRNEYRDLYVIRHKSNNKWFALIFDLDNKLYINLKIKPETGFVLREQYSAITPAWHMNKKHWIKVDVNNIETDVLKKLIEISYELTSAKKKINYISKEVIYYKNI